MTTDGGPRAAQRGAKEAGAAPRVTSVATPAGEARVTWHAAAGRPRLLLALGHGAGGGIEARDLQALATVLPGRGVGVALVEQPWRVAGKKLAPAPTTLDKSWRALWPVLAEPGLPVVAGGRSAGARVACRTARDLGARAVLALSFPLHPPGRPEKTRIDELLGAGLPTLVVQGGSDPFGKPSEFPDADFGLLEIAHADHGFAVPGRAPLSQEAALETLTEGVATWLGRLSAEPPDA